MHCPNCKRELPDSARFCGECGEPAGEAPDKAPGERPDGRDEGKKPTVPIVIAAAALCIAAALAGFTFLSGQPSGPEPQPASEPTAASEQTAAPAGSEASAAEGDAPEESGRQLTPEEEFVKSLDGWWGRVARQQIYGDNLCYIHDGVMDTYSADGNFIQNYRTVTADDVVRFDGGLGSGGVGGPGWFIYGPGGGESGMYVSDSAPGTLSFMRVDGTGYSGGDTLARTEAPEWASWIEGDSSAAGAEEARGAKAEAGEEETAADSPQAGPGEVAFTGTVVATTFAQRQADLGLPASTGFANSHEQLVLLQLDEEVEVDAANGDGNGRSTRPAHSIWLGPDWASRDGEHVSVAVAEDDLRWPSDVTGALVSLGVRDGNIREM